ncbi:hypothetical protein R1sor_022125 [Riccia sorocarpa]|uniref:Cytochrome b5 heme-binding domain-containing protein n=1 Tax=Riccia sorocarpa TaxID=122646 RepID=A0ABD3GL53_9MARC
MGSQVGEISADELSKHDGSNADLPLLVAIRGKIYDVSSASDFYGPGKAYAVFAGKDATRALAKMSTKAEDVLPSVEGLTEKEIGVLDDWEKKFNANSQMLRPRLLREWFMRPEEQVYESLMQE